ncbi:MAG: transglutaminase family protein [Gammaproteobacteria bacterium]|nr:transglutaminase family protein [Gammaproteobacteria bacterium]
MLIRIGFDIVLDAVASKTVTYMLQVHPSRQKDLQTRERFRTVPELPKQRYIDAYGNHCGRISVPDGCETLQFLNEAIIFDDGAPDEYAPFAQQLDVADLPVEALMFVLPSRYCEVDSELMSFAWNQFQSTPQGWTRVQAVCDFVHQHLQFNYALARANRTALEAFHERVGVCRDFAHLAITLCRCMNIPARYVTGYLGDIGVPRDPSPMDFSAWFEVYLGERWYTFDARHNQPRIGRVVIARGRDAVDVPITMVFGAHALSRFNVVTEQVDPALTFQRRDLTGVHGTAVGLST